MKKVLSIVLSLVMVICMMPVMAFAGTAPAYSDIAGEKCEASVELLTELGVVDGYTDGTFKPAKVVTRAEMAKLIVTALGLNPTTGSTSFKDMAAAQWAIPSVGYAESLGIINGYGNGKFGPNDKVTYDQAITMIVRALGYTTDCNEMQGTWPAVFVQKANELGLLKDVSTTGSSGANRGDIAIMLANALHVQMVYADKDGTTIGKTDADGKTAVTMYSTLVKGAGMYYGVVDAADTANATKNIRELLGAAGKIVVNEDGDVVSVSDIKSTFMTGKFNKDHSKFTVDGVDYTVKSNDILKTLDEKGKVVAIASTKSIPVFANGVDSTSEVKSVADIKTDETVTIAATVSGKTLTGIFSVQTWKANKTEKITDAQIAQIEKNKKLLGSTFTKDNNGDINTDSFILKGVDSLDKIAEDNIVAVYTDGKTPASITKVEVGTEVVSGEITRVNKAADYTKSYITIDGKDYKFATNAADEDTDLVAGNDVTLYLAYNGKIFDTELTSGTTGNYAVVLDATEHKTGALASQTKVQLLTADGVQVFVVDTKKVDAKAYKAFYDSAVKKGNVVKFALNTSGEIKSVTDVVETEETTAGSGKDKVTAKGYLANMPVLDGAVVFAAPVKSSAFDVSDTDDLSVLKKSDILGKTVGSVYTYVANTKGEIEFLMVSNSSTSEDVYGVLKSTWTTVDGTGASYYEGKTFVEKCDVDGSTTASTPEMLRKIVKNADGTVKFTPVDASAYKASAADSLSGNKVVLNKNTYYLADDVQIYIYDTSDNTYDVDGVSSDLIDDANTYVRLYTTAKADSDNAGLVTYVVITRA